MTPEKKLRYAAREVVNDFDRFGEVLQTDDDMNYGPNSPIERLRIALIEYETSIKPKVTGDKEP